MVLVVLGVLFAAYLVWLAWPEKKKQPAFLTHTDRLPRSHFGKERASRKDLPKTKSIREKYSEVQGIRRPDDSTDDLLLAGLIMNSNSSPVQEDDNWKGGGGGFSGAGASSSYDDSSSSYDSGSSDSGGGDCGGGDSGGGGCD